jgi:hypothetical protein
MEDAMGNMQTEKEKGRSDQNGPQQGDNRTPDRTIGQVKYADSEAGGDQGRRAGATQTTPLERQRAEKSQKEGPAAYAPHENEDIRATSGDPAKKKTGEF